MLENKNNNCDFENKDESSKVGKYTKGFYFAFAICLITMVSAAFLTYSSVSGFLTPDEIKTTAPSEPTVNQKVVADITGVTEKATEITTEKSTQAENTTEATTQITTDTQETTQSSTQTDDVKLNINKKLQYPVSEEIIKEYSNSSPVYSKTLKDWRVHNAVDYKAVKNTTVNSIDNGIVAEITSDSMYGTTIAIEHNSGFTAYYSSVKPAENLVQGSHVSIGDVIGVIDTIPCESKDGLHLHLAVMKNGKYINPQSLFENEN